MFKMRREQDYLVIKPGVCLVIRYLYSWAATLMRILNWL